MFKDMHEIEEKLYANVAKATPQLARNQVWCRSCGSTKKVDSAQCFRHGWPKCCGHTMTIDSPEEQKAAR